MHVDATITTKMTTFKKTLIKHEPNVITRQFDDAPYWKHLEVSFSSFNHIFDVMSDNQVERIMQFSALIKFFVFSVSCHKKKFWNRVLH